jgi:hypothetical protein
MIDIVLVIIFCYQLNRMARERGISPWPYVLNYVAAFFLMIFSIGFIFLNIFGMDALKNEEAVKSAMMFEPFAIMFEVFLFIYFRKRIQKSSISSDRDNDFTPPPPPEKPKKDLSYFR